MFDAELVDLEAQISALVAAGNRALADAQLPVGSALGAAVLRLDTAIRRLEALRLRVGRAHAASGEWRDDGARNAAEWHRAHRRVTRGAAARELRRRTRPPTSHRRGRSLSGGGSAATFSPTPFKPGPVRPERPRR